MRISLIVGLTFFCVILSNTLLGQNAFVGMVQDTLQNPLSGVNVRLVTESDTVSKSTDQYGGYAFDDIRGKILYLTFTMMGYDIGYHSMFVLKDKSTIEIPKVSLAQRAFVIKDVNIIKVLPILVKKDTIQFNFDAYKFRQNSLLEEAIKGLPGFNVTRDGAVYYNGKVIRRAQVNNKDFFGGDLLTATKNLPTGFIQNLQVIDYYGQTDEATGLKNGEPEKIINITLRPDKKQIYFGHVTAGGGTNDRFLGSLGLNRFNDGKELSITGTTNNTNTNVIYLGGLGGVNRNRSLLDVGDYAEPIDGLNTVSSIGFNLSDKLSKRLNLTSSYNFVRQKNVTDGFSQLTSTYIGNTIRKKDDYRIQTDDFNHNIKFGINGKFSNKDELRIDGKLTFNKQVIYNQKTTELRNAEIKNIGTFRDTTETLSPNGNLDVFYSKHFDKKGRKFVGNMSLNSNNFRLDEVVNERYSQNGIGSNQVNDDFLQDQRIEQNNVTNSARASLTFVEPFAHYGLFEFNYTFDVTGINSLRYVYDKLNRHDPLFIDSLAVDYNYVFKYNRFGINYLYETDNGRFKVYGGVGVEPIVLEGNLPLDNVNYVYENINLVPSVNLLFRPSKDLDWQIDYKGKNNQPNFSQIAPVVDNSNSRSILIGNPELKSEFGHRTSIRLRKSIVSRAQYFETSFAYNFVKDKIVSDKTSLLNSTIQQTTFRNTSGYFDTRWFYVFNTPFVSDDVQLDLTGNWDYFHNPSFIDNRKRVTNQVMVTQSVQMKYLWSDYFESGFIANYNLNSAQYDIPFKTNITVHTMQLGLNTKTFLNDNFSFGAELSQRFNNGYANSFMNENQTVINGFVEYSFLMNRIAMLRLQGFDLLDQNKSMGIYSEYIGNDVYEARNNRLGRYFMLSLSVRLQKYPKK